MRKLMIAMAFGAVLLPNQALTLGLGDIEIHSALNQQLDAEIELLSAAEGDTESLIVQLASREEFQRAGLDRPFMLNSIRFSTIIRDGVPFIKLETPKPVREPFLNFLVEVDWPQGHLIREYTLLLDPPIFSDAPSPKPSVSSRPAASEMPTMPVTPEPPAVQDPGGFRPSAVSTPAATTGTTTGTTLSDIDTIETGSSPRHGLLPEAADGYRIQKGDTAWSLAERLRPDSSVSVEKMMLALLRTNPEAFIQENVNGLKRGYVLRVPEASEINSVNQAEALALVRQQNALWREYQQAMASGKPMPGHDAGLVSDATMSTGVGDGRLAIVGIDGGTSAGTDPTSMTAEELRNELALTSEQLETERLEKEGLRNRVAALQSQLDQLRQEKALVSIEDREMAEMQAQVSPADTKPAEPEVAEAPVVEEQVTEPAVEKIAEPEPAAPQVLEPPAKPKAATPPPPPPPKPAPGLLEDPMILMAAGGVLLLAILAAIAFFIKRRKSAAGEAETEEMAGEEEAVEEAAEEEDHEATQIIQEATQIITPEGEAEAEDEEVDHDSTMILQAAPAPEAPAEEAGEEAVAPAPVEEETDDVIAEADVYLAYGIYQQAEELLEGAIQVNPDKEMYRVKLCETKYAAKDADGFEAAAKAMFDQTGGAETAGWLKVASLGKDLCPDSDLFKNVDVEANVDTGAEAAPAEMDIDLGVDEDAGEETLDFDIDAPEASEEPLELPDFEEPSEEAAAEPEAAAEEEELEFDIGETDALDLPEEEGAEAEEEFSLDIEASELDIEAAEDAAEEPAEEAPAEEAEEAADEFVDESLDFGIDEIESAETTEEPAGDIELDLETAEESPVESADTETDEFDISMGLGEEAPEDVAEEDVSLGLDEEPSSDGEAEDISMDLGDLDMDTETESETTSDTTETSDDEFFDASMDLGEAGDEASGDVSDISVEDDGSIDLGFDLDEESSDDTDIETEPSEEDATMMDLSEDSEAESDDVEKTVMLGSEEADEFDLDLPALDDVDEISTKLDLARAYMDMGDADGTRSILDEVLAEGNDDQKQEAENLLKELDG